MLYQAPLATPKDVAWFLASLRARRQGADRGRRPARAGRDPDRARRGARPEVRGRAGRALLPLHAGPDALLRRVLGLGAVEQAPSAGRPRGAGSIGARSAELPARADPAQAVLRGRRPWPAGDAEPARGARLGGRRVSTAWTAPRSSPRFEESHAVQYFYEPFLEAFDPELRKELGVWYTPPEIVQYMVARVDTVLREELGIARRPGRSRACTCSTPAAAPAPIWSRCCGRSRRPCATRAATRLLGNDLKQAALERVFGFEILPAPFVVAHLQLGLLLQNLGAPLSESKNERVGVYLTNALTGWEPPKAAEAASAASARWRKSATRRRSQAARRRSW